MKKRTGTLQLTPTGYRFRVIINGKQQYHRLESTDGDAARKEMEGIVRLLQGENDTLADTLRGALARVESAGPRTGAALDGVWTAFSCSMRRKAKKESTLAWNKDIWDKFVAWAKDAGITTMDGVTVAVAGQYASALDQNADISVRTVDKYLSVLCMIWKTIQPHMNPWIGTRSTRVNRDAPVKHRAFTDAQMRIILNTAPEYLSDLVWVQAYTGLRLIDCARLKVGEVFFGRGVIVRLPEKTGFRGDSPMEARIGIHPVILPILKRCCGQRVTGYVFERLANDHKADVGRIVKRFQSHLRACGIEPSGDARGRRIAIYGTHSFRYVLQSTLIGAGVPGAVVDLILAHKSPGMGQHYTEISDQQLKDAIGNLPDWRTEQGKLIELQVAS